MKLYLASHVKYLGVIIDSHLNWNHHYNALALKLTKVNGALSKLRHCVPKNVLITVYHALFNSHLSYANIIWAQASNPNLNRILKIQKKSLRILTFSHFQAHSKPLFHKLNLLQLPDLVKLSNILLLHQILNSHSPVDLSSVFNLSYQQTAHQTRGSTIKLLRRPNVKTTVFGLNSIRYKSILNWNSFQSFYTKQDLASLSLTKLKQTYHNLLISCYN